MSDRTASRAGLSPAATRQRPLYARVLRLRHLNPSGLLCFVFFEAMVALGVLLALAELTNWWSVVVLPVSVAAMVKINDAVAAAVARSANRAPEQTEVDRAQAGPVPTGLVRSPMPPAQAQSPSLHRHQPVGPPPMTGPRAAQPAASQAWPQATWEAATQTGSLAARHAGGPRGAGQAGPQTTWETAAQVGSPVGSQGGQQVAGQAGPQGAWEAAAQTGAQPAWRAGGPQGAWETGPQATWETAAHAARQGGPQVAQEAGPHAASQAAGQAGPPVASQGGQHVAREAGPQGAWEAAQSGPPEAGRAVGRQAPPPAQHAAPYNAGQADPWAGPQRRPIGAIRRATSAPGLSPGLHPELPIPVVPGPQAFNPAMPRWNEPDTADLNTADLNTVGVNTVGVDTAEIDSADLDTTDLANHPLNRSPAEIAERRVGWPQAEHGEIADTPESRARQSATRRYR